ncbi:MAG: hypothetical protein V4733_09615 [Verrucomicrobiota bacterium]
MKSPLLIAASLVCATLLPSCLQHETTINLKTNGSGTLVEETRFGAQMVAMLSQMPAGETGKDPFAEMFSEEKAKARTAKLGDGVTFEKIEKIDANGAKGVRIIYKFADINKLQISPGSGMSDLNPEAQPAGQPKPQPIRFKLEGDDLTVEMPKPQKSDKPADAKPKDPDADNPQAEAMAKQMMSDMKVSLKIVAVDGIDETNATHRDGATVTLMEMDMGKILNQPGAFKKLQNADDEDPAATMAVLKGIDGMKFETKEKIVIDLK